MLRSLFVVALIGCGSTPAPTPSEPTPTVTAPPVPTESGPEALARAEVAAKELGGTLKGRVVAAMGEGGPTHAVEVCNAEAGDLTSGVAERTGVAVGRSSLRLRNPSAAGPAWVAAWLQAQGERAAEGVTPLREVAETPDGAMARVILPIVVEAPCLACHGGPEQVPAEVAAQIAQKYPADAANGYAVGDLRGALWAETKVR